MTMEELKACNGYTVQVSLDGADALATIEVPNSADARPALSWPVLTDGEQWDRAMLLPLTDRDIASFSVSGHQHIVSDIRLSTDGGRHRVCE